MGETKVEPGRDDPLEGEVVIELWRRQEVFFPVDCEGPGWIQTPQGEFWPSTSLWVQHQFRRENGERLPSSLRLGQEVWISPAPGLSQMMTSRQPYHGWHSPWGPGCHSA